MAHHKNVKVLGLVFAVIGVQVLTSLTDTSHHLTQLTMSAYYSLVIVGLCLLIGYAGQISLGHAGFFAIGGYISAFLTTYNFMPYKGNAVISLLLRSGLFVTTQDMYGGQILTAHPWTACVSAVCLTLVIASVIGGPVLKLKGHYLAMATLGFGIIVYKIVLATEKFGAADGISDVPGFAIFPGLVISGKPAVRVQNYYIAWGLVTVAVMFLMNLVDSRVGRALRSIHGAEDASSAMGIDTAKYKLHAFVLSAVLAGVAGVLLTHYNGGIGPSEASIMKSVRYVAIVAIGGMANLWGTLTMGALLNFLSLRGYFGVYDDAVFGGILIIIMLFAPEGLLHKDLFASVKRALLRKADEGGRS
jgi:branched-chain amino acid transport system permease protein